MATLWKAHKDFIMSYKQKVLKYIEELSVIVLKGKFPRTGY